MKVELIGGCTKDELETRIKKVASAGKLSRFPGDVFEVLDSCDDMEENIKLIRRIIGMGHKSIIEHDYLVFAMADVSLIVEQTIIGNRLTSFTIKSRRAVDFRDVGYYTPDFRDKDAQIHKDNKKLQKMYSDHMDYIFNTYSELVDNGIKPEDARFILPPSFHGNIIMGIDVRELEKLTVSLVCGPLSKISELKELGENFLRIINEYVPYLSKSIEKEMRKTTVDDPFEYLNKMSERPPISIVQKPALVSYTPNIDEVILISSIMYHYQCSKQEAREILDDCCKKDLNFKEKLMDIIVHKEERRELEQVQFTFQMSLSLSTLPHLTRHRMHSLLVPEFFPIWDLSNYAIPPEVIQNKKCLELFKTTADKNVQLCEEFKQYGVMEEDLIVFYMGCTLANVVTTLNARSVQWIARLRCCNKAQWQIRYAFQDIVRQVKEIAPLFGSKIGPTCITDRICNEGRESCGLIDKLKSN